MNSFQRKVHRSSWILLAIGIPVFMFFAVKHINYQDSERLMIFNSPSEKVVLKTTENKLIRANLYDNHLEIILLSPLKNASTIVYSTDKQGKQLKVIGQLTSSGTYTYTISDEINVIELYDAIKQTEITKLLF